MMSLRNFFQRNKGLILEVSVIFVVALASRLWGIGLFLTADEKNWVGRSFEFIKAWRHLDINSTFQTTHPGITTLWVAGLSVYTAMPIFQTVFNSGDILKFTVFARVSMVLVNVLLVCLVYVLLRKIIPKQIAFLAVLVVALDPFLVGYSRLVHVDAFLTGFLFVAVLFLLLYQQKQTRLSFYFSGIFAALAILTKIPAIIILPFAFYVFFFARKFWNKTAFWGQAKKFILWCGVVLVIFLAGWPSLWWIAGHQHALDNANQVRKDMTVAATQPHDMDEPYTMDFWHYPATLLSKTTIPVQLGILFLVVLLASPKVRRYVFDIISRRAFVAILIFVFLFTLEMTIGGKKGDRYILPIFPFIDLLGVIGIYAMFFCFLHKIKEQKYVAYLSSAFLLVPIIATVFKLGPYTLAYYNPLFPPNLSQELGWGEGLDQVAKYIDSQPGKGVVASWYPEELRAITKKQVLHINAHEQPKIGYIVLYRNMFGRSPDHWANDFIDEYYKKRKPDFVAHVNGLEYAWVYKRPVVNGIVGEILPGQALVTDIDAKENNLSGIRLMMATYSGKVKNGTTTIHIRTELNGKDLRSVTLKNSELADGGYTKFSFEPIPDVKGKTIYIILTTEGTVSGSAPTVRVARDEKSFSYAFIKQGSISETNKKNGQRQGQIGMEWYFIKNGKEVSHLEIK